MENLFANTFYKTFNTIFSIWSKIKKIIWALRNKDQIPQLLKLQKRVLNELKDYDIVLPTKFKITIWETIAYHDPNTDTVFFPLCYLNPDFRFHSDSCLGYIRHEYGHACIEHYWEQVGINGFKYLFGDYHQPYEEWLFICWRKRRFDWKNYVTKYAQVHPAEDFAESFFIYLQKKGDVEEYRPHRTVVWQKMQYVKKVLDTLGEYDFSKYSA